MSEPARLPHLFGRFTVVMRDHADVGKTLQQIRAMCQALDSGHEQLPDPLQPARLITRLRVELSEHFALEEEQGYFGTVVEEAPALRSAIETLCAEHQVMLRALEELLALVPDRAAWGRLPGPVRELVRQLELHERAEAALLHELFHPTR